MKPLIVPLLLVCFCVMLDAQTTAPAGPSMQETTQWIVGKLMLTGEAWDAGNEHHTYKAIKANIDSCVLSYSAHYSRENSVTRHYQSWDETHTFHLGGIVNVQAFPTDQYQRADRVAAYLSTSQADRVIYADVDEDVQAPSTRPVTRGNVGFPFGIENGQDNDDLMTRMQKALTHAAELCAASYKERNGNEPF